MHNDECCTGQKWRVHAHTHEHASCAWFDHSHTRPKACRAPFGWGSTNRQAKRRASHLGQTRELLAQEHEHIGGRRQAGILTRQSLNDVHTHSRIFLRGTTPGSLSRGLASTPNVLFLICTASPDWAGAFAAKRIRSPSGSCNCACRCVHSPRGDSPKRSLHPRRIRRLWLDSWGGVKQKSDSGRGQACSKVQHDGGLPKLLSILGISESPIPPLSDLSRKD